MKKGRISFQSIVIIVLTSLFACIPLIARAAGSISGSVTPVTGQSFQVGATLDPPCGSINWANTSWTDTVTGAYEIPDLEPGEYYVQITNTGVQDYIQEWYASPDSVYNCEEAQAVPVFEGQVTPGIDFQLDQGGYISGYVYQADGETGIANIFVNLFSDPCTMEGFQAGGTTDENGFYFLRNLVPDSYYLLAGNTIGGEEFLGEWWAGGASVRDCHGADIIIISAGETFDNVNFQLERSGRVTGTVYEFGTNTPLSGIGINFFSQKCGTPSPGAITDDNGNYLIWGTLPGTYYFQTWGDTYVNEWWTAGGGVVDCSSAEGVEVVVENTTGPVNFYLVEGASVSGYVLDNAANPLEGVCI
jgi:hypothetical protein